MYLSPFSHHVPSLNGDSLQMIATPTNCLHCQRIRVLSAASDQIPNRKQDSLSRNFHWGSALCLFFWGQGQVNYNAKCSHIKRNPVKEYPSSRAHQVYAASARWKQGKSLASRAALIAWQHSATHETHNKIKLKKNSKGELESCKADNKNIIELNLLIAIKIMKSASSVGGLCWLQPSSIIRVIWSALGERFFCSFGFHSGVALCWDLPTRLFFMFLAILKMRKK